MALSGSVPHVPGSGPRGPRSADDIDYEIRGQEMQFVEIELDPGESAIAEAGSMMFKAATIEMDTVFGDGTRASGGILGKLATAGKRILTGESLFMTVSPIKVRARHGWRSRRPILAPFWHFASLTWVASSSLKKMRSWRQRKASRSVSSFSAAS